MAEAPTIEGHSLLEVADLHHYYDDVPVLNGVHLAVGHGESVFVIGANGAGKSTLALAVSGLVRPTRGSIRLGGDELVGQSPFVIARMGVSYTPAGRSTFHYMTVYENLELGFEPVRKRTPKARQAVAARIDEMVQMFPRLERELRKSAGLLSGGMQRMVEVARALMPRPRMLILDEPTLGLSGAAISDLIDAIEQARSAGVTLLVIEQNVPVATEVCERGYLLSGGRVTLAGASDDVLRDAEVQRTYLGVV